MTNLINWISERKRPLLRCVLAVVALINLVLQAAGKPVLPIDDATIQSILSGGFALLCTMWAWWKDNDIKSTTIETKTIAKELFNKIDDTTEELLKENSDK